MIRYSYYLYSFFSNILSIPHCFFNDVKFPEPSLKRIDKWIFSKSSRTRSRSTTSSSTFRSGNGCRSSDRIARSVKSESPEEKIRVLQSGSRRWLAPGCSSGNRFRPCSSRRKPPWTKQGMPGIYSVGTFYIISDSEICRCKFDYVELSIHYLIH